VRVKALAVMSARPPATPSTIFRPDTSRPAAIAGGAAGIALLLALASLVRGLAEGINFAGFAALVLSLALLGLAGAAGYWAWALNNLRYELDDGALHIVWGLTRQVVPLAHIERVVRGRSLGMPAVRGLDLPYWGCHVGHARVPRLGEVLFYSTHRAPEEILYLVTPAQTYGINPRDPGSLIGALQALMPEVEEDRRQEVLRSPLATLPAWADRFGAAAAALSIVLTLAVVGVVFARYTAIPSQTILNFPDGDRPGSKTALLGIPAAALALLLINLIVGVSLHRPLRPVAYTLVIGGLAPLTVLLVAAFTAT
jgi:hypothetical protein